MLVSVRVREGGSARPPSRLLTAAQGFLVLERASGACGDCSAPPRSRLAVGPPGEMTFVTESPSDLRDEILGLVDNWVSTRSTRIVSRVNAFVSDGLWRMVGSLGPGQAPVSFTDMRRPVLPDHTPAMLRRTVAR